MGLWPVLEFDSARTPHISFGDYGYYIEYATKTETGWEIDTIAAVSNHPDPHTDIALNSEGIPHVVYTGIGGSPGGDIYLAKRLGDTWEYVPIDTSFGLQGYPTIAIDSFDNIHIAYYNDIGNDIWYAYYDGKTWYKELVDSAGYLRQPDIQVDMFGVPHIVYSRWALPGEFRYAVRVGESKWDIDTIYWGANWPSLVLDEEGNPYVAHRLGEVLGGDLLFSYKVGDTWVTEVVDTLGNTGWYPSIALAPGGYPVIIYSGGHGDSLCMAIRLEPVRKSEKVSLAGLGIKVYPNPTNGFLYIDLEGDLRGPIPWSLYDIQGRLLLRGNFSKKMSSLDLTNLTSGIYFLKIQNKTHPVVVK
jgi:hypothetical protein